MEGIQIKRRSIIRTTTIANTFFDEYMPKANGEFVKIYLYIYRLYGQAKELSLSSIADIFCMTEADVLRALKYWEKQSLLSLTWQDHSLSHIELCDIPESAPAAAAVTAVSAPVTDAAEPKENIPDTRKRSATPAPADKAAKAVKPVYSMSRIQQFCVSNAGDQLFFVIEQYLGKTLSQTDINTIVFFHEQLKMSCDLIEYLFEYCVSNNHKNMNYIEKVALSWTDRGIDSIAKAKANAVFYNKTYFAVLKSFGISNRNPADSEIVFIRRWHEEYGFDLALIIEACNRTMLTTHAPSFEYTDSILKNWKSHKVISMTDIKALDEEYARKKSQQSSKSPVSAAPARPSGNKFHNFNQRSYDYNELEKKLTRKLQPSAKEG